MPLPSRLPQKQSLEVVLVAMLMAKGHSQKEIAEKLRKDATAVSRLVRQAELLEILQFVSPKFDPERVDPDTLKVVAKELEKLESPVSVESKRQKLLTALEDLTGATRRPIPREVHILPVAQTSRESKAAGDQRDEHYHRLGRFAAGHFVQAFAERSARHIGILWGKTIRTFVDAVKSQMDELRKNAANRLAAVKARGKKLVVPLTGSPYFWEEGIEVPKLPFLPSTVADLLASHLNTVRDNLEKADCESVFYPLMPAVFPVVPPEEAAALQKYFKRLAGYKSIFGPADAGKKAFVDELDTIITSVGCHPRVDVYGEPTRDYADPWRAERCDPNGKDRSLWAEVIGDLGGVLLARDSDSQEQLEGLNKRWLGAKLQHYRACAERAVKSKGRKIGVFMIADGKPKAKVVLRAIAEGCVNVLVCDTELADELLSVIQARLLF